MNSEINPLSLMSLFEVGTHRGNKKSKLNPKLKSKIYGVENSICLIDLVQTKIAVDHICNLFFRLGQKGRQILVIGTSKHIRHLTKEFTSQFQGQSMPYINNRWLGGTLTNWATIKKTLKNLEKLENIVNNQEFFDKLSRKEQLSVAREKEKILKFFAGLKNLKNNRPGAILVIDTGNNPIAIAEAEQMKVPVVALTNTNSLILPQNMDNAILCNNNSVNAVKLIVSKLIESYNAGVVSNISAQIKENENITNKKKTTA